MDARCETTTMVFVPVSGPTVSSPSGCAATNPSSWAAPRARLTASLSISSSLS